MATSSHVTAGRAIFAKVVAAASIFRDLDSLKQEVAMERSSKDCRCEKHPRSEVVERILAEQPTQWDWGKADVTGEETGKCTLSATVVGVQASEDRSAEITLGSA